MQPEVTYQSTVNELFFQADLNGSYESNLKYYRTLDVLRETKPAGFTVYPPLSALGTDGRNNSFHSFQFELHPYTLFGLGQGRLNIDKRGYDKNALSNFVIYYVFKSGQEANKVYQSMIKQLSGLAAKQMSSQVDDMKYSEFFDSSTNFPGLRISLDNGDEITNGYVLTFGTIREATL